MITINFNVQEYTVGFQAVDALYAFYQSLSPTWTVPYKFSISQQYDPDSDFNVLCLYMPQEPDYPQLESYDLILINNSCEPLIVATPTMRHWIESKSNCYFICNSFVTQDHQFRDRIIWWPDNVMELRNYWTKHFYPTLFQNIKKLDSGKTKDIIYINGRNDAWRHHVVDLLSKLHTNIFVRSGLGTKIFKVVDCQFESQEDTTYRHYVNAVYQHLISGEPTEHRRVYYDQSMNMGIDDKFGKLSPGYIIMDEYFDYRCVIFPESTWQNNEVAITEKILKCCYAKTIPWPVGGSNINRLYNQVGFGTAWNLLPPELQDWDSESDHVRRHEKMVIAMAWLAENPEVLQNDQAKEIVDKNFQNFMTCRADLTSMQNFSKIVESMIDSKQP